VANDAFTPGACHCSNSLTSQIANMCGFRVSLVYGNNYCGGDGDTGGYDSHLVR
jgi:hypothetical protein